MGFLTTIVSDELGRGYVEATEALAVLSLPLPCWSGMHWDGYVTTTREARLFGKDVVIQAWKGSCDQFALLPGEPGGVGGEVGVYHRIPFCPVPSGVPDELRDSRRFEPPKGPCDLWWPHTDERVVLGFELFHPKTREVVCRADHDQTKRHFWLSRLLDFGSYQRFEESRADCPAPTKLKMHVRVGDITFEW